MAKVSVTDTLCTSLIWRFLPRCGSCLLATIFWRFSSCESNRHSSFLSWYWGLNNAMMMHGLQTGSHTKQTNWASLYSTRSLTSAFLHWLHLRDVPAPAACVSLRSTSSWHLVVWRKQTNLNSEECKGGLCGTSVSYQGGVLQVTKVRVTSSPGPATSTTAVLAAAVWPNFCLLPGVWSAIAEHREHLDPTQTASAGE